MRFWRFFGAFFMNTFLLIVFIISAPFIAGGEHLLMFGDSIDRIALYHYCEQGGIFRGSYHSVDWQYNITVESMLSFYCETHHGDILSFIHIFGSQLHSPYTHIGSNSIYDTEYRVTRGLQLYQEQFGCVPDRILFHTTKWEKVSPYLFKHIIREDPRTITKIAIKRDALKAFERNTKYWIEFFQNYSMTSMSSKGTESGTGRRRGLKILILRTVPVDHEMYLLESLNDVIRTIARRGVKRAAGAEGRGEGGDGEGLSLYLYEMHEDLWWISDYDQIIHKHMFLDSTHPCRLFLIRYIEKLFGYRYSSQIEAFHSHGGNGKREKELLFPRLDLCQDPSLSLSLHPHSHSHHQHHHLSLPWYEQQLFLCPKALISVVRVEDPKTMTGTATGRTRRLSQKEDLLLFTAISPINHKRYFWTGIDLPWMKQHLLTEGDIMNVPYSFYQKLLDHANDTSSMSEHGVFGAAGAYKGKLQDAIGYLLMKQEKAQYRIRYTMDNPVDSGSVAGQGEQQQQQKEQRERKKRGTKKEIEQDKEKEKEKEKKTIERCLVRYEECTMMFELPLSYCDSTTTTTTGSSSSDQTHPLFKVPLLSGVEASLSPDNIALAYWKFGISTYSKMFEEGKLMMIDLGGLYFYTYVKQMMQYEMKDNKTLLVDFLHSKAYQQGVGFQQLSQSITVDTVDDQVAILMSNNNYAEYLPYPPDMLSCLPLLPQ